MNPFFNFLIVTIFLSQLSFSPAFSAVAEEGDQPVGCFARFAQTVSSCWGATTSCWARTQTGLQALQAYLAANKPYFDTLLSLAELNPVLKEQVNNFLDQWNVLKDKSITLPLPSDWLIKNNARDLNSESKIFWTVFRNLYAEKSTILTRESVLFPLATFIIAQDDLKNQNVISVGPYNDKILFAPIDMQTGQSVKLDTLCLETIKRNELSFRLVDLIREYADAAAQRTEEERKYGFTQPIQGEFLPEDSLLRKLYETFKEQYQKDTSIFFIKIPELIQTQLTDESVVNV